MVCRQPTFAQCNTWTMLWILQESRVCKRILQESRVCKRVEGSDDAANTKKTIEPQAKRQTNVPCTLTPVSSQALPLRLSGAAMVSLSSPCVRACVSPLSLSLTSSLLSWVSFCAGVRRRNRRLPERTLPVAQTIDPRPPTMAFPTPHKPGFAASGACNHAAAPEKRDVRTQLTRARPRARADARLRLQQRHAQSRCPRAHAPLLPPTPSPLEGTRSGSWSG